MPSPPCFCRKEHKKAAKNRPFFVRVAQFAKFPPFYIDKASVKGYDNFNTLNYALFSKHRGAWLVLCRTRLCFFVLKEVSNMLMRGSQIVMECLLEQGVDTVFGYPGGTILNIYDEFELHGYNQKIRHYLTAHEQGASHAADGYARSTGKVGVCFATSGPGATNLVTGIATAYYDSSPVVFITCNVSENLIGKDSFQEVDITGITMPITKCNFLVKDVNELADVIREAFAIARSGRPGPVLVDIAKNVTAVQGEYEYLPVAEHPNHGRLATLLRRSTRAPPGGHRQAAGAHRPVPAPHGAGGRRRDPLQGRGARVPQVH